MTVVVQASATAERSGPPDGAERGVARYYDLDAAGSRTRDGAVSPPAPLPEGLKVGHLMGHLSSADAPVRNGFI
jgi:hypothetical protein